MGKDPDIRATSAGSRLASFSIATSTKYRNKETQQLEDKTEWHRVVVFNDKLADVCEKYLRKGSRVYVEGQLQTRKWTDNNGVDKYTTEVVIPNYSGVLTILDSRSQSQYPMITLVKLILLQMKLLVDLITQPLNSLMMIFLFK